MIRGSETEEKDSAHLADLDMGPGMAVITEKE